MATTALSPETIWCIAMFSDTDIRLNFLLMSSVVYAHLRPILYRYIVVGIQSKQLIPSLANNPDLPPLSLVFEHSAARVDPAQWMSIIPALTNLRFLIISPCIPLSREVVLRITFRLQIFGSLSSISGAWLELIALQPELDELLLDADFLGETLGPEKLPVLRCMKGRPADLAKFACHHRFADLWFFTGPPSTRRLLQQADLDLFAQSPTHLCTLRIWASQFLLLFDAAPTVMTTLEHLVLDEENSWSDFTVNPLSKLPDSPLAQVVTRLSTCPHIKTILLVCSRSRDPCFSSRRLLERSDSAFFSTGMSALCVAPRLRTFHFYGKDGFVTWENWGLPNGFISYMALGRSPVDLNYYYAYLF
ncbi:hypothetical protein B0H19DRAFT_1187171 [Mycena capillaripes]|nr:hypothetical protein B0H19DRAFT_1186827 [Mycena capillaripes]KAJ6533180.1 hypothetical protein B0H19DRAFT_1187171 [Mycena capillaripes]